MVREVDQNFEEYVTFQVTSKDGVEIEMAVVDEFEFEKKHYVVGAKIENDTVCDDGVFIYKSVFQGDDLTVEKISDEKEYQKIAEAYTNM